MNHGSEPTDPRSALRIGDIANYLRGRIWLALGVPLLFVALGVGVVLLSKPIYRSEALLLPISDGGMEGSVGRLGGQLGGLASLAGLNLPGSESAIANVAILRSRDLVARFIEREDLLPVLFAGNWDAERKAWTTNDPPTIEDGIRHFERSVLSVVENKDTGLVRLSVDYRDPRLAANWARQIIAMADQDIRRRAIDESRASMTYLERQLEQTSVIAVQQSIHAVMEAEVKRVMLANVRPEYAFRVIDPPRAPDADDPVWPNVPLVLLVALTTGIAVVLVVAVIRVPTKAQSPG